MKLKQAKYLMYALAAATFVTVMAASWLQNIVLLVIALGLCVALIAVNLAFWRCPYCGGYLGRRHVGQYCIHCGRKLDDDDLV